MVKDAEIQIQFWQNALKEAEGIKHLKIIEQCQKHISEAMEQKELYSMNLPDSIFQCNNMIS